ncbi:hypothetical protein D3C86_1060740 [compost metagenome]
MQHQCELAARAVAVGAEPVGQRAGSHGGDFFELLGELAADGDAALAQHGQRAGQAVDAVRRFQQHHGARLLREGLHGGVALAGLARQEAREHEGAAVVRVAALAAVGHEPSRAHERDDAAGARQRQHALAGRAHGGGQARAGVAHAGRAGVAHVGDALALREPRDHGLRGFGLVVLVHREQLGAGAVDAVGAQQALRVARVLAGDGVHQLQHMQRAQRDVGQVADRRGDDIQRALRIMLRARGVERGRQGRAEGSRGE